MTSKTKAGDRLIGVIDKGHNEQIRVLLQGFRGQEYVNIRTFFKANDGKWWPTKKGVALNSELLPELADLIQRAARELE